MSSSAPFIAFHGATVLAKKTADDLSTIRRTRMRYYKTLAERFRGIRSHVHGVAEQLLVRPDADMTANTTASGKSHDHAATLQLVNQQSMTFVQTTMKDELDGLAGCCGEAAADLQAFSQEVANFTGGLRDHMAIIRARLQRLTTCVHLAPGDAANATLIGKTSARLERLFTSLLKAVGDMGTPQWRAKTADPFPAFSLGFDDVCDGPSTKKTSRAKKAAAKASAPRKGQKQRATTGRTSRSRDPDSSPATSPGHSPSPSPSPSPPFVARYKRKRQRAPATVDMVPGTPQSGEEQPFILAKDTPEHTPKHTPERMGAKRR
jgi:hypothetical protein